ncbi:hypothetical protein SAMN05421854_10436 [Amycolatopsis rubida]|uniref:Uncharacterized protein n=1 Tax=Amycolatopsis rubida TaxID=112413 RepID=A0A1I5MG42_9PSEU|nr:hypothetical protein SAMN05421854_10436 [Amycolatopsis rubida]
MKSRIWLDLVLILGTLAAFAWWAVLLVQAVGR